MFLSFDGIRGCFTASQSCYGYCIFIVLLSFDRTTVAATQPVNCVTSTAYSLYSSHLTELVAATQPVNCVISTAYSLCSSHWTELQWLLVHPGPGQHRRQPRGDHLPAGHQRSLQESVRAPAALPHPLGRHDLLRGWHPDAAAHGHPQVRLSQFDMVSVSSGKSIFPPPRLSESIHEGVD